MSVRKAFPLRISETLYEELRRWADAEFRSVNGQIEFILQRAVAERTKKAAGRAKKPGPAADDS